MRRLLPAALFVTATSVSIQATALVWPDVPDRVEGGLSSPDPVARRTAARDLATLGGARVGPLVLKALSDSDIEVRLAAAQAAIRLHVAGATDATVPWLSERDARLRIAACEVARVVPSPASVPSLARTLGDSDPLVRAACADALGASGSPEAVTPLSGKLEDSTPNVRLQVARALARLGDGRAVVPLVGKVQDSAPEVRQAVVRALGDLADPRATQALLLALRDTVPEVKVEALSALGRLRAQDAVEAITPLMLERHPMVRQSALVALGRIGSRPAVLALVKALGQQEDATAKLDRSPVREALVSAQSAAATELTALLDRPISPTVATSAAWVLGELKATASAPAIVAALRKGTLPPDGALRALAGAGTAEQVPVVLEFVSDPNLATREEALRAASALLDPEHPDGRAVEPLAATLRATRTSARERAVVATLLGRTGAPRATGELIGLVSAKDPTVRLAAIDALGALGAAANASTPAAGSGPDDVLVPLLSDTDPAVRLHAAVALGASGGPKARHELIAKLDDGSELDRFALLEAIGGVLERHPDEAAVQRLVHSLGMAAGPERDAVIIATGRARLPSVVTAWTNVVKTADREDRRAIASVLAAQAGSAQAQSLARALAADPDANVRAEAAFALGAIGDMSLLPFLVGLARGGDPDLSTNATAAIARIGHRAAPNEAAAIADAACPMLNDGRAGVRANALVALAASKRRCGDGRSEQKLLIDDPSELVRSNAARALVAAPRPDDRPLLDRCASTDRNAEVALLCRPRDLVKGAPSTRRHAVTAFVVNDAAGASAQPRAPFLLEYEDGLLRTGAADRRGALFDPAAPAGTIVLRRRQ